ncbi:DNA alkylation repair protein [Actinomadura sp. 7K507]|uniref:DNA alkylation repair protein n=1 Tax=Actinomadura sp. 7K507 TaxID=2530365 RepID=UPI0014050FC3|nr:DNA alkylation repair protein [Actinomadura sp. 7K507]
MDVEDAVGRVLAELRAQGDPVRAENDLGRVLDEWVNDPYMWIRRTAVLALLAGVRAGNPDLRRVDRFGDALIGEREFFIRKALGWVLRELSKKDPGWVTRWVEPRVEVISGVTIREAVRWLPEEDAGRLLAVQRR